MNLCDQRVRDVVISNPAAINIFEEFHIDYCCNGEKKLADACSAANADLLSVLMKLEDLPKFSERNGDRFAEYLAPSELVDYIVNHHHTFTRDAIGRLDVLMESVRHDHGSDHTELGDVDLVYGRLKLELTTHMQKEEFVLFPYIKELAEQNELKRPLSFHCFGTVQLPVRQLMQEHDIASELLAELRRATHDFRIPNKACLRFRALYLGLSELEYDLHQHVHLENNVLFPMAIALEQKFLVNIETTAANKSMA